MSKVDWSKAPEGTTHRLRCESIVSSSWRKIAPDKSEAYYWDGETWKWLDGFDNVADISDYYDERPEEPEPVEHNPLRIPVNIVPPPGATRVGLIWGRPTDDPARWDLQPLGDAGQWHEAGATFSGKYRQDSIELVGEQPEPEWNGTGQPPVGTVCDWLTGSSFQWERIEVLGYYADFTWMRKLGSSTTDVVRNIANLRPILTEAQQAVKDKKDIVDEICRDVQDALKPYNVNIDCSVAMRATIEALYDKGYFEGDEE